MPAIRVPIIAIAGAAAVAIPVIRAETVAVATQTEAAAVVAVIPAIHAVVTPAIRVSSATRRTRSAF